jgi:hypothetical protein
MTNDSSPYGSELGRLIWETSRADEGTISFAGANIIADAIRAAGYFSPDQVTARIRAAQAEALEGLRDALYRGEGPDLSADSDIVYGEWIGNRADQIRSRPCSCGSPDTTSLNPREVVVHRADGTCYIDIADGSRS